MQIPPKLLLPGLLWDALTFSLGMHMTRGQETNPLQETKPTICSALDHGSGNRRFRIGSAYNHLQFSARCVNYQILHNVLRHAFILWATMPYF